MSSDTDVIVNPDTYVAGIPHATFARLRAEAAVVWVDDGILTFVGGTLDADEVLAVARGLR